MQVDLALSWAELSVSETSDDMMLLGRQGPSQSRGNQRPSSNKKCSRDSSKYARGERQSSSILRDHNVQTNKNKDPLQPAVSDSGNVSGGSRFLDRLMEEVARAVAQQQQPHSKGTMKKSSVQSSVPKHRVSCTTSSTGESSIGHNNNRSTKTATIHRTNTRIITYRHYGQLYQFEAPVESTVTHQAAIQMERMVRGWWQRLQYRIIYLQYQLTVRVSQRTRHDLELIRQEKQRQMEQEQRSKVLKQQRQQPDKGRPRPSNDSKPFGDQQEAQRSSSMLDQSRQIVEYLRHENRQLRIANEKTYSDMEELRKENKKLEQTHRQMGQHRQCLEENFRQIQDTQDQLRKVIPQYQANIRQVQEAIEIRQRYGQSEQKTKILYADRLGRIINHMEQRCSDSQLLGQAVDWFLEAADHGEMIKAQQQEQPPPCRHVDE